MRFVSSEFPVMPDSFLPAPLWRRFAAAFYDGLLLLAIWMATAVVEEVVRDTLLKLPPNVHAMRFYMFIAGLAFFGWFWTHGGQTLGMRAWHLRVIRTDGAPLRWPIAALRYAMLLLTWAAAVYPLLLHLPVAAAWSLAPEISDACIAALILGLLLFFLDGQRRAPLDFIAGTLVVSVPKETQ
jgi:uncharacterized RDD family membrane protein YckC